MIEFKNKLNIEPINNIFILLIYLVIAFIFSVFLINESYRTSFFYFSIILFSVLLGKRAEVHVETNNKILYFINMLCSFALLFLVFGLRNYSGIDDPTYIRIFESIAEVGWFDRFVQTTMEPGYLLLNYIVSLFTNNYIYMQIITSFIPLALFYYGFHKYRKMISIPMAIFLLSTLLYFQMLSVGLIRMFISISIVFVAFSFIIEQKPQKYIISILIATIFHYSSFFLIVLVIFHFKKYNLIEKMSKVYFASVVLAPILFIGIGSLVIPLLGARYQQYGNIGAINLSISSFTTIPIIILLLLFYRNFTDYKLTYFKFFLFVYSFSVIIFVFGDMINMGRLVFYSYSALVLSASMVSRSLDNTSEKLMFNTVVVMYGILYLSYSQFNNIHHIPFLYPYDNFFFTV